MSSTGENAPAMEKIARVIQHPQESKDDQEQEQVQQENKLTDCVEFNQDADVMFVIIYESQEHLIDFLFTNLGNLLCWYVWFKSSCIKWS